MPALKRGPRPSVDLTPLPFEMTGNGVDDFCAFCEEFIRLEKGVPMVVRCWQRRIIEMLWGEVHPKLAALAIGRGNSKSTLSAAIVLYLLFTRDEWSIDIIAVDERQSGIIGGFCTRMVARHPELEKRCKVYKDHLVVGTSELWWLPANAAALEGRLPDFTVCDEGGRIDKDVFGVASFSNTKKPHAQLFMIGTPGPNPENVLAQFRSHALSSPEDTSQRYMEFSADEWHDHPLDCDDHGDGAGSGCLSAANPALGDWLSRESVLSNLPPKSSESEWRRVRLIQFWATGADEPFIDAVTWDSLATGHGIPDGSEIVVAVDGGFSGKNADTCAVIIGTVSQKPHFAVYKVYQSNGDPNWRMDILRLEQDIRDLRKRYKVREAVFDPFRLGRSMQILQSEKFTVSEFAWNASARATKATTGLHGAAVNGQFTHSGDETLRRHVLGAVIVENDNGIKIDKASSKRSAQKIDCAAALLMCWSRCTWLASQKKRSRVIGVR